MINHARKLLNISSDMIKIKTSGAVSVSTLGWRSFRSAAMYFESAVLTRVPEDDLRLQYREYCRRLEQVCKMRRGMELSSKEVFSLLLDPKENLYKDIEGVLSVLARACAPRGWRPQSSPGSRLWRITAARCGGSLTRCGWRTRSRLPSMGRRFSTAKALSGRQ